MTDAEALLMGAIIRAIRDYHFALDSGRHGGVAAHKALDAIQAALGMPWKQGEEVKDREAAIRAVKRIGLRR